MSIKSIEITNVRGISKQKFELNLIPNKPNLLVASNGFGKSSLAIAFDSVNSQRIKLHKDNAHKWNENNSPELKVEIQDNSNKTETLTVNKSKNQLSKKYDLFVINSQLIAKATKRSISGFMTASASLEVKPIILNKIPPRTQFKYSLTEQKDIFGKNGKILPNINLALKNPNIMNKIFNSTHFNKCSSANFKKQIQDFSDKVNSQSGNTEKLKSWIETNYCKKLDNNETLTSIASILSKYKKININDKIDSYLASIQIFKLYNSNKKNFEKSVMYLQYKKAKKDYSKTINSFYSGSAPVTLKEDTKKKELFVKFPKAHQISNGERDILSFVLMLEKAKRNLKKDKCILIIDEIFDYLDDANLIAFQYYVTKFIKLFKKQKKELYPLLLTHLDPNLFNHFCFGKNEIKIHYLDKRQNSESKSTIKMVEIRSSDSTIKDKIETYYFHYHPKDIDCKRLNTKYKLPKLYSNSSTFKNHASKQVQTYLKGNNYDSVAICFAVRIKIEENIYNLISNKTHQKDFIGTHTTTKKLDYAESLGLEIPDIYYLLGFLHNDMLHWKQNKDFVSPITAKLEHPTIKQLIKKVF